MRWATTMAVAVAVATAAAAYGAARYVDDPRDEAPRPAATGRQTLRALVVVSKKGHPTHPTWYHDAQLVERGGIITVAWNGDGETRAGQVRADDFALLSKVRLNEGPLGGVTDSTGTDTDRHDVPAVVADGAGRLAFLYGGGSLAARGSEGPYMRRGSVANAIDRLGAEQRLAIGDGAAFDFEAVTDATGTVHLIGQHGRGRTGALVELRLGRDGTWLPPRVLIEGGLQPGGCVLDGRARGCNRFAIGRLAADRATGRLHLVWGWSEDSLSGKCRTDAGFCDHDLMYAYSDDGGATWHNAGGGATVRVSDGPLQANAAPFRVVGGHVGLFKAVAAGPAGPLLVYTTFGGRGQSLMAARLVGGRWRSARVAESRSRDAGWSGSLVLRGGAAYGLWTPTGDAIHSFTSADGVAWRHAVVYRGPAWSLTGAPSARPHEQLLLWRGKQQGSHSWVMLGAAPAP
jgi:hypothetical protein